MIVHVVLGLRVGGLERVVVDLANSALPPAQSAVVCLEQSGPVADDLRRVSVIELRRRPGLRPRLVIRLWKALRSLRVDLVHTHNSAAGFYGALAGKLCRVPIVNTKHGSNRAGTRNQPLLNRVVYRLTDHVVAVSESARRLALSEGADGRRLSIIDNGIDTDRFARLPVTKEAARKELGLPADGFVIGSVARLSPEKNHALLLRAFELLAGRPEGREAWLVVVGGGPLEADIRAQAASMCSRGRVLFTGTRTDVSRLLSAFDVFVLSSDIEGLPIALLEAMASEVAPIVTRVGAMPEVVQHGKTGLVVTPGDSEELALALVRLHDQQMRRSLSGAAKVRVIEHYSVQRMAREYEGIYSRLLGASSAPVAPSPVRWG